MTFIKNFILLFIRFCLIVFGIIAICCLPKLFLTESKQLPATGGMTIPPTLHLNFEQYIIQIQSVFHSLLNPAKMTYKVDVVMKNVPDRDLFPFILDTYVYTLTIMIVAFLVAVLLATFFANLTFYFSKRIQSAILKGLHVLETLPDLFVVFSIQLIVIWIYKHTNLLPTIPFSTMQEKTYFLPIVTLAILPTIYLYKITLLNYHTEIEKEYTTFALAKGMKPFYVLYKHVLINVLLSIFYNAKSIYFFMLSNMIVLEFLFNIYGLLQFLITHPTPEIMAIGILLLTIPFYIIFEILKWVLPGRRDIHV